MLELSNHRARDRRDATIHLQGQALAGAFVSNRNSRCLPPISNCNAQLASAMILLAVTAAVSHTQLGRRIWLRLEKVLVSLPALAKQRRMGMVPAVGSGETKGPRVSKKNSIGARRRGMGALIMIVGIPSLDWFWAGPKSEMSA